MLKKFALCFLLSLIFIFAVNAQHVLYKDVQHFKKDIFGNIYVVKEGNRLEKYDSLGVQQAVYSTSKISEISSIDVSDPFNILVYIKSFGKIIFLDKSLSEKLSPIELQSIGFTDVETSCLSYNNGFWIFDNANLQLIRFNNNLNIDQKSADFNQIFGATVLPQKIWEFFNYVYLLDANGSVFVFDRFGAYIRILYASNAVDFNVSDVNLFVAEQHKIISLPAFGFDHKIIFESSKPIKEFAVEKNQLFLLYQNGELWKYNL